MRNTLLRRNVPSTFRELAGQTSQRLVSGTAFTEKVLQDDLQQLLESTHWRDREVEANRPRRGDLSLTWRRSPHPYFVVELKRDRDLSQMHEMQGRNYAASHRCPCIVTNSLQYRLIVAQDNDFGVTEARLPMKVKMGQHIIIELGEFSPRAANGTLERLLDDLFQRAAEGPGPVNQRIAKLVANVMRKGAPRLDPPPRGLLPSGRR